MRARAAIIGAALAAAFVPVSPAFVERAYSRAFYPAWQSAITSGSNLTSFALLDVVIALVVFAWIWFTWNDLAHGRRFWATMLQVATRTLAWGSAIYLVFLVSWGLNYRRVRLTDRLDVDTARVATADVRALAVRAASQLNALHAPAHAGEWTGGSEVDTRLASAFGEAEGDLGVARHAMPARPKGSWLDLYFRRAVVDGMTDPIFLETLVVSDLLPFERPFVTAHEWAHLAGFAHEGEANFVGWLACMRGDAALQYSGWLFLYNEAASALPLTERPDLTRQLAPGPLGDLRAMASRVARNASPRVSAAGWSVYNQYLKSQGVESGTASYNEVIRLILGTRFNPIRP